jgi:O-succinylbenzoate synthase
MRIVRAEVDELAVPLVEPFETSFGVERTRRFLVLRLTTDTGLIGHGECVASPEPRYSEETLETARWAIIKLLLPLIFRRPRVTPESFRIDSQTLRGNSMAKAAVEDTLWDLRAQEVRHSLSRQLGGVRRRIEVGVSVGIQPTVTALVRRVGRYLEEGYRRIKLKVRPGWDERPVGAVRREFPDVRLWVDANQAYFPRALNTLRRWATRYEVEQVEQPFAERAIAVHARLAQTRRFRVCLDESITGVVALEDAFERRALTSLNVKPGRVGGLGVGLDLGTIAQRYATPAWVGGMLETGIGRAANVALASCRPFTFPADLSASDRYYAEDLVDPPFELGPASTLRVPDGIGLGVTVNERRFRRHLKRRFIRHR